LFRNTGLIDKLWWILWQERRVLMPGTVAVSLVGWQKMVNAHTSASLLQNSFGLSDWWKGVLN